MDKKLCLARQLDGKLWSEVGDNLKGYNPVTGAYILKDGSSIKRKHVQVAENETEAIITIYAVFHSSGIIQEVL